MSRHREIITVSPSHPEVEALARQLASEGMPADAREVYSNRRNFIGAVPVEGLGGEANIKSFKVPGWFNARVYGHLRPGKARRSYDFATRLIELGFDTPEPLACVEVREGTRLGHSYYVSRQVPGTEMRYADADPDCDRVCEALGREMARLHRAGVWMTDFTMGNVLYHPDATARDGYRFYHVDLNRSRFDVHDRRKLMLMFRNIVEWPEKTAVIARSYAEAMGLDPDATVAEALGIQADFHRYLRRKRAFKSRLPWRKK